MKKPLVPHYFISVYSKISEYFVIAYKKYATKRLT